MLLGNKPHTVGKPIYFSLSGATFIRDMYLLVEQQSWGKDFSWAEPHTQLLSPMGFVEAAMLTQYSEFVGITDEVWGKQWQWFTDSLHGKASRVNCATVATVARIMHLNWEGLRSRTQLTGICNLLTPNVVHTVTCNLRMQWKRS